MQRFQVSRELLPVVSGGECGPAKFFDDRIRIALAVRGERVVVGVSVGQQPGRHWKRGAGSRSTVAKHDVYEGATCATVSIGERVNRFELSVRDGRLCQQ